MSACTCHMDGSYITGCPIHGEKETLIWKAERKLRTMTKAELRAFVGIAR